MKRVLKTRTFCRWMKKTELTNEALQKVASDFLSLTPKQIDIHIHNGYLQEICNDD